MDAIIFVDSGLIVFDSLRILETKREKVHHRILLGLSCSDIIAFLCHFMSSWPIPIETHKYGAIGSDVTCSAQGFLVQLSIASPLYNTALSIYYLLAIRFHYAEDEIRKFEPYIHGLTIIFSLSTATLGLALNLYSEASFGCWIASDSTHDYKFIFQIAMWLVPLSICLVLITVSQIAIVIEVREAERSGRRFSSGRRRSWTDQVCRQSIWYVGTFYATWIIPGVFLFMWKFYPDSPSAVWYGIPVAILTPLQGCFNAMVYFRPRYLRYKRKHPDAASKMVFFSTLINAGPTFKNLSEGNHTQDSDA
jgi:hypothetical protein